MDVDEDSVATGAASARKRQRRNADSGDTSGHVEAEAQQQQQQQIGEEKSVSVDSVGNNNNNNEKGDMMSKERATALEDKQEQPEATPEEEVAGPSYQMCQLSSEAAVAVVANNKRSRTSSAATNDSDYEEEEVAQLLPPIDSDTSHEQVAELLPLTDSDTSPRFNQRHIPRTRSYRRISVELLASVTDSSSDSSSDADDPGEASPLLETADAESEVEEAVQEVEIADDASSSSSSSDSNAIWRQYDFSSDSDSTIEEDDGVEFHDTEPNAADRETIDFAVTEVMCKCKPAYSWISVQELMQREHNIINRIGWRGGHTSTHSFAQGYYGSRLVIEQMSLLHEMSQHSGCVNCLNFNRSGDLVCSGSDDLNIIVWDWAKNEPRHKFRSGHSMNIFQTKFIDSAGCLDIVSASRDGQVRRAVVPPSGGITKPTRLYSHTDAVHKIVVVPLSRHEVMSAGEDGAIKHFDLRTSTEATTMLRCVHQNRNERGGRRRDRVRLFSIAHHPFAPEFCVSGSDDNLRVYDKRKLTKPVHEMTPRRLQDTAITQITCAVYNHSGSEILASYSDAGIYLYDSRNYTEGETLNCYEGHINSRTIKGVNFFGPRSEYIVSGSDCGNIFFWEKQSAAIVNFMKGDHAGVVNCLEPHPWMPVLATSGLEHKVKIWTPNGPGSVPNEDTLKLVLQRNFRRNVIDTDFDINQFQYFIRQFLESSPGPRRNRRARHSEQEQDTNQLHQHNSNSSSSTTTSNDSSPAHPGSQQQQPRRRSNSNSSDGSNGDGEAAAAALDTLRCRTQ
ncbi:DDB1- and CUL4-associated factor 8 isoform X2 [Drosophila kikkawai]|uniref:DDB1- and CUL4-associated factor 8 isoform X2 n=1 Tax=Drosophila kikkawai TaxID=30033 RepID=A0A6P4J5X7_DROKI|nr:DDB1- and CUL4-associated factor 8 isoform X2 [Drosophila kikkawai]